MHSDPRTLILGSSSPWRRKILAEAGYAFETMDPDIDEKAIRSLRPDKLVIAIAYAKANALLPALEGRAALLITCDQVGVFEGKILEKPVDGDEARMFLRGYRGRTLSFYSAVMIVDVDTEKWQKNVDVCNVEIGALPDQAISEAIRRGDVLGSCGAFVLKDPSLRPYVRILTSSESSCEGLPLELLRRLLAHHRYPDARSS